MTDFVRDLESELLRAARRRARPARGRFTLRPPALLAAALVAAALLVVALAPRAARQRESGPGTAVASSNCLFPDVSHLLRDGPCTSNPFTRRP